jgi:hypothetical protein
MFSPNALYAPTVNYMSCRLKDADDDVRSVAASCLIPVTKVVVERLPDQLSGIMSMLWSCLRDMKDDLGSSVGAVMELLGNALNSPLVMSDQLNALHQANLLRTTR